jgi:hypothetical protein
MYVYTTCIHWLKVSVLNKGVCVFAQCTPGLGVCSFVYLFGYFECTCHVCIIYICICICIYMYNYNMQLCRPFDACNSILNKLHPQ